MRRHTTTLLPFLFLPAVAHIFSLQTLTADRVHNWLHWGANLHSASAPHPALAPSQHDAPTARTLAPYIVGAADINRTQTPAPLYQHAMMSRPELDLIMSYMRPSDVFLEYGSGGSTLNIANLVSVAYVVEHNCQWARHTTAMLAAHNVDMTKLHIKCVHRPRGFRGWGTHSAYEHANYEQFKEYVDVVTQLAHHKFDRVLIDGRARLACALKVLPFLDDDSLVFIHDFYARTPLYAALLPYYIEVARVRAVRNRDPTLGPIDEPQGLVVLRRRADATFPLPDAVIHARYAHIDWRVPFGAPLVGTVARVKYYLSVALDAGRWQRARHVHALVHLVRRDVMRVAWVYAIVMLVVRNWAVVLAGSDALRGARRSAETCGGTRMVQAGATGNEIAVSQTASRAPRFMETEGMKAANARRKQRAGK